jgi:hypothetical protein
MLLIGLSYPHFNIIRNNYLLLLIETFVVFLILLLIHERKVLPRSFPDLSHPIITLYELKNSLIDFRILVY